MGRYRKGRTLGRGGRGGGDHRHHGCGCVAANPHLRDASCHDDSCGHNDHRRHRRRRRCRHHHRRHHRRRRLRLSSSIPPPHLLLPQGTPLFGAVYWRWWWVNRMREMHSYGVFGYSNETRALYLRVREGESEGCESQSQSFSRRATAHTPPHALARPRRAETSLPSSPLAAPHDTSPHLTTPHHIPPSLYPPPSPLSCWVLRWEWR